MRITIYLGEAFASGWSWATRVANVTLDSMAEAFAAHWLHSRFMEVFLLFVVTLYGWSLLLVPNEAFGSKATADLAWLGYGPYLSLPLLVNSVTSAAGLVMNIYGVRYSKWFRVVGAALGFFIWFWLFYKLLVADGSIGFMYFCLASAIASVRIMGLALADLPPPGDPWAKPSVMVRTGEL